MTSSQTRSVSKPDHPALLLIPSGGVRVDNDKGLLTTAIWARVWEAISSKRRRTSALKPEVRRRLDEIASQTLAHIAVVNSPLSLSTRTPPDGISSSAGWSGLETERVCELVITGQGDSVEIARVR